MTPRRAQHRPSRLWWLIIAPVAIISSVAAALAVNGAYQLITH